MTVLTMPPVGIVAILEFEDYDDLAVLASEI